MFKMDRTELPLGFGFALAQNTGAMKAFANLSAAQQEDIVQKARRVSSKSEMQSLVNGLSEWAETAGAAGFLSRPLFCAFRKYFEHRAIKAQQKMSTARDASGLPRVLKTFCLCCFKYKNAAAASITARLTAPRAKSNGDQGIKNKRTMDI